MNWLKFQIAMQKHRRKNNIKITLLDIFLIWRLKNLNSPNILVKRGIVGNFWLYSYLSIDKIKIPHGLILKNSLYFNGKVTECTVFNKKNIEIGVLDVI